jgi:uroporphyrinogen-III synthase
VKGCWRGRAGGAERERVVVFRGDGGREELGDAARAGRTVDYVACYRRAAGNVQRAGRGLRAGRIDAVTITSSRG